MKTTKWFRKRMVLALVVFICGIALMGLVYIVNNKPYVYINPGIVTSAPTTTTRPIESVRASRQLKPYLPAHMNSYTRTHRSFGLSMPSVPMRGMYETSRAKVQHVGSGTNGVYATTGSSSHSSSQRGIQYSTGSGVVMPMTTFTSMASARQVAQPEAQQGHSRLRRWHVWLRLRGLLWDHLLHRIPEEESCQVIISWWSSPWEKDYGYCC